MKLNEYPVDLTTEYRIKRLHMHLSTKWPAAQDTNYQGNIRKHYLGRIRLQRAWEEEQRQECLDAVHGH